MQKQFPTLRPIEREFPEEMVAPPQGYGPEEGVYGPGGYVEEFHNYLQEEGAPSPFDRARILGMVPGSNPYQGRGTYQAPGEYQPSFEEEYGQVQRYPEPAARASSPVSREEESISTRLNEFHMSRALPRSRINRLASLGMDTLTRIPQIAALRLTNPVEYRRQLDEFLNNLYEKNIQRLKALDPELYNNPLVQRDLSITPLILSPAELDAFLPGTEGYEPAVQDEFIYGGKSEYKFRAFRFTSQPPFDFVIEFRGNFYILPPSVPSHRSLIELDLVPNAAHPLIHTFPESPYSLDREAVLSRDADIIDRLRNVDNAVFTPQYEKLVPFQNLPIPLEYYQVSQIYPQVLTQRPISTKKVGGYEVNTYQISPTETIVEYRGIHYISGEPNRVVDVKILPGLPLPAPVVVNKAKPTGLPPGVPRARL